MACTYKAYAIIRFNEYRREIVLLGQRRRKSITATAQGGREEADTTAKKRQRPLLLHAAGENMPNPEGSGSSASNAFIPDGEKFCYICQAW